jgi:hypothetical protein
MDDYVHFFKTFGDIAKDHLKYEFVPEYLMSDASKAINGAALRTYGNKTKLLMCWFHVRYNIRKRMNLVPKQYTKFVNRSIKMIHNSLCAGSFKLQVQKFNNKLKRHNLNQFHDYFNKQWIDGNSNWIVFNKPPGYASTNNPIEQFNGTIKKKFTDHIKFNIVPALNIFSELISAESLENEEISKTIVPNAKTISLARKILTHLETDSNLFHYKHKSGLTSTIDLIKRTCTCFYFMDKGVCKHLVGAAIKSNLPFPGLTLKKTFQMRRRKKIVSSESDEQVSPSSSSSASPEPPLGPLTRAKQRQKQNQQPVQPVPLQQQQLNAEQQPQPQKKKRGRPRKAGRALDLE